MYENKGVNHRFPQIVPDLGGMSSTKPENESEPNNDQQSLIIRDKECVICMDHQRGNKILFKNLIFECNE
jgi:hypothetical protein